MPENWKTYRLGDIAEVLNTKRIPLNSRQRAQRSGAIPYYGASGIVDYIDDFLFEGEHVLISEDGENLRSRKTPIAFKANGKFWVNNHAHILKGNDSFLNDWIVYYIANLDINPYISGAVQPKLNKGALLSIPIVMPELEEVKAIANILSALDDKIENNLAMNKTLEDMAMALYKHWFVDFGPFQEGNFIDSELGPIPEGWEVKRLDEVAIKKSESFDFKIVDEVVFVNTGDVQEGRFLHSEKKSKIGLPGQAKKAISKGDILYSEIRPKNKRYAFVTFDSSAYVVSTKFMIINPKENILNKLLYRILTMQSTVDNFKSIAEGRSGTFPQITFDAISDFEIILPPLEIQKEFQKLVSPMEMKQDEIHGENQTLTKLRDTLLPKLISGEVRLAAFEEEITAAL
jgi:type I restriction enzyme S subunit